MNIGKDGSGFSKKIVVLGGYGQVGKVISCELSQNETYQVYAAGRNMQKAEQFSVWTDGKVFPMEADISKILPEALFENTALILMCMDDPELRVATACAKRGIDYIDITANYTIMQQLELLIPERSRMLMSVGLAPGITNLLVKNGAEQMEAAEEAQISVMLGLGEKHGKAAIEWTVDQMSQSFSIDKREQAEVVRSFTDGRKTNFFGDIGVKTGYRFDFADQHIVKKTANVKQAATRLTFDSAITTALLAFLQRIHVLSVLKLPAVRNIAVQLFDKLKFGTDIYAVKAEVIGKRKEQMVKYEGVVTGYKEFKVTAMVAVYAARLLLEGVGLPKQGVYHLEQLAKKDAVMQAIKELVQYEEKWTVM